LAATAEWAGLSAAPREPADTQPGTRSAMRVLIVDEPGINRDGLCALLRTNPLVEIVAAIASRREAVQVLRHTTPDVVIMDFSVRLNIGPETIEHLKRRWPQLRVLVLTMRPAEQFLEDALQAGADGYILKSDSRSELFTALQRICAGRRYVSSAAQNRQELVRGNAIVRASLSGRPVALTHREQEVMTLIAGGLRNRDMAQMLSLSHKTVEKHRSNLMRKLGLRSAAAVVAYAITHGYV
jgi:DNA-binding NarL/FixJ family response regulator